MAVETLVPIGEVGTEEVPRALGALIAVIGAERARRARDERRERAAGPGPHHGRAGGRGRATLMWDARGRGRDREERARLR